MGYLSRFACAALAALALLSAASAGVNAPQSGWYSGNPLLGPNTLTDLACGGSTCYASGDFGTLLKSSDAGATWSGIVTGLTLDLQRVRLAGGSPNHVIVGGGCALRRSDDGGDTFFRMPFTARDIGCSTQIVSLSFPTEKTGYLLLTNGRVLSTGDGGHSFARRTPVPGGANDILCPAERTCFTVGASGSIQRTTDGGVSWTQVASFPSTSLLGLERVAPLTIYAVGAPLVLVKSSDGGSTWTRKTVPNGPSLLRSIRCGDALHCLITNDQGSQVVRTTDGGDSFTSVVPSPDPTFAVAFATPTRAIAAGALGSAEITADAGATWAAVGSRIAGFLGALTAVSDSVAYAGGGQGVLARTDDGGQSWSNVSPPTEAMIAGLAGFGAERVYVLASDGTLQRSDNGGNSYRLLNPGNVRPVAIAAIDADRLLLLGQGIVRSDDGGESFHALQVPRTYLLDSDVAPGAVFVYGPGTALVSTDRGAHWRRVPTPKRRAIRDLDFAAPRVGYLLDNRGSVWRTSDRGRHWRQLPGLGTDGGYSLEFADAKNGYVLIRRFGSTRAGLVLRTADGGNSWHPQLVSRSLLTRLESGGATDYALVAENSSLYATDRRGDTGAPERLTVSATPRSLSKPGSVSVRGRLNPADGGEEIVVGRLSGGRWTTQRAIAASNGTFVTRWRLNRTSVFVAQVLGDADHVGAGTPPLTVRVG